MLAIMVLLLYTTLGGAICGAAITAAYFLGYFSRNTQDGGQHD